MPNVGQHGEISLNFAAKIGYHIRNQHGDSWLIWSKFIILFFGDIKNIFFKFIFTLIKTILFFMY